MNGICVRPYTEDDIAVLCGIWNEVVEEGAAFPQEEPLDAETGKTFFASQSHCGVAVDEETGSIVGLYILHPNNIGRCAHTANTSYAVDSSCRGRGVGRALVQDSLDNLKPCGFRGLQFNAVVASNVSAIRLYESMGFDRIGVIPGGFLNGEGAFEDMIIFHHPA